MRPTWKTLLGEGEPLLLPAAHDALTARLIARAGFKAYQVGGFALAATRWAFPDIDLVQFYEENEAIRQIVAASPLPVMVDAGDGSAKGDHAGAKHARTPCQCGLRSYRPARPSRSPQRASSGTPRSVTHRSAANG